MVDKLVKSAGWLGPKGEFYYAGGHKTHQTAMYEIIEDHYPNEPEMMQIELIDKGWIRIDYSYIMTPPQGITKRQFDDLRWLLHIKPSTVSNREIRRVLNTHIGFLEPGSTL